MDDPLLGIPVYIVILLLGILMAVIPLIVRRLIRFVPKSIRWRLKNHRGDRDV